MLKRVNLPVQPLRKIDRLPAGEYQAKIVAVQKNPKSTQYKLQVFVVCEILEGEHEGKCCAQCFQPQFMQFAEKVLKAYDISTSGLNHDFVGTLEKLVGNYCFATVNDAGYVVLIEAASLEVK
jgi:hypothetical protein